MHRIILTPPLPWSQVLLVDLDLGECMPPPDSARDDAFLLPYAPKLLSALEVGFRRLGWCCEWHHGWALVAACAGGMLHS